MRLIIAEKPSLARAIVDALSGKARKDTGCYRFDQSDDVVTWCIGHLLEQAEPEAYNPAFKRWSHDTLPILPDPWQWVPRKQVSQQLSVLRQLIKNADTLVHAGDPDREGQLLVDEVLAFLKVPKSKLSTTQRLLVSDLNKAAVQRALTQLRSNSDFQPLSTSALARSRADWLYGINLTRAMTLQGQAVGYRGVLSIGRVQTPVLGLVVRRDDSIDAFVSEPFFDVIAVLTTASGASFEAKWVPSEACEPWLDEQGRNRSLALAQNVVQRISHRPARLTRLEQKTQHQPAPLPHSLASLQMDANRAFGMSAQQVLDAAQALYETHKAITYPRSDSHHLPTEHHAQASTLIETVGANLSALGDTQFEAAWPRLDPRQKSKAWNDSKVGAHHAIIPTERRLRRLNPDERKVYRLVCRNYLAQFMPAWKKQETRAEVTIENGCFRAAQTDTLDPGWKALFPVRKDEQKTSTPRLPALTQGEALKSQQARIDEKHTTPPKPFTEASLLAAMTGISRFVSDPQLKTVLKDTDGLGTEATRAGIIELLFKRGFLQRQGKSISATAAGKALIHALPDSLTLPDRTARWESLLGDMANRQARYQDLMTPLAQELTELCQQLRQLQPTGLSGLGQAPRRQRRRSGPSQKPHASKVKRRSGRARPSPA
ncbi:MAG: DNA topoisomerase III [Saccharospirillum sp.]